MIITNEIKDNKHKNLNYLDIKKEKVEYQCYGKKMIQSTKSSLSIAIKMSSMSECGSKITSVYNFIEFIQCQHQTLHINLNKSNVEISNEFV